MFESIQTAPPDAIMGLNEAFQRDERPEKVNLTIGVYMDENGDCPILDCVKRAEGELFKVENSKIYLGIGGMAEYGRAVRQLVLGDDKAQDGTSVTVQTPGGTGALRVAAEFVKRNFPQANVWCTKPTWANHPGIFRAAGLEVESIPYLDSTGTGMDEGELLEALAQIPAGDLVCLHACCHNPTGIDPSPEAWKKIAAIAQERQWLALVDFAYQGFADGLEEDAGGIRALVEAGNEVLVASSFSKNFGLYGERVGALTAVASSPDAAKAALSQIKSVVRTNYSNPPKHGATIVAHILDHPELRPLWDSEVADMRNRIHQLRQQFVASMQSLGVDRDYSFIERQRGMFSFTGLSAMQVDQLRSEHAIYIVGSGRVNIAGLNSHNLPRVCQAIAAVSG